MFALSRFPLSVVYLYHCPFALWHHRACDVIIRTGLPYRMLHLNTIYVNISCQVKRSCTKDILDRPKPPNHLFSIEYKIILCLQKWLLDEKSFLIQAAESCFITSCGFPACSIICKWWLQNLHIIFLKVDTTFSAVVFQSPGVYFTFWRGVTCVALTLLRMAPMMLGPWQCSKLSWLTGWWRIMFFTISRKAAMLFLSNLLSNRKKGKDITSSFTHSHLYTLQCSLRASSQRVISFFLNLFSVWLLQGIYVKTAILQRNVVNWHPRMPKPLGRFMISAIFVVSYSIWLLMGLWHFLFTLALTNKHRQIHSGKSVTKQPAPKIFKL